jgi:hypothetical protein
MLEKPIGQQEEPDAWIFSVSTPCLHTFGWVSLVWIKERPGITFGISFFYLHLIGVLRRTQDLILRRGNDLSD